MKDTTSPEIHWVQILASAPFGPEQNLIHRLFIWITKFTYENTEDAHERRSNPDFMCFFVRCETKRTSDFDGNKKIQKTCPEFKLLPCLIPKQDNVYLGWRLEGRMVRILSYYMLACNHEEDNPGFWVVWNLAESAL